MRNRSLTLASVEAGKVLLRYLRAHPTGSTFKDLAGALRKANLEHCSEETARRGLKYLRDYHDAPIVPVRADNTWALEDPNFRIPLVDPTQTDLASAIFAAAVLEPIASSETRVRIERMVEMMDLVVRQRREVRHLRQQVLGEPQGRRLRAAAKQRRVIGGHGGPPCATFSRSRHRRLPGGGGPRPLRHREDVWMPKRELSARERTTALVGSLLALLVFGLLGGSFRFPTLM